MLPRPARLHQTEDFRRTVRHGVRVGRPTVVVHATIGGHQGRRVGFVVSKTVGGAVVRNTVKRRLRHLAAERIGQLPVGTDLVVRALPAAATTHRLADDLDAAWRAALDRLAGQAGRQQ